MRFAAGVILGGDDRVEKIPDAQHDQRALDEITVSTRSDGQRDFAVVGAHQCDDIVHRFHLRDGLAVIVLLAVDHFIDIQRQTELRVQTPHDVAGRHAAPCVEKILGIGSAEVLHGAGPCREMQRHVVGQRAVAIENERAEIPRRQGQGHGQDCAGGL